MPPIYFSRYAPSADRWNRIDVFRAEWLASALDEYMEQLFRVQISLRIEPLNRIYVPEKNKWFSATCNSDTLVAIMREGPVSARASIAQRPAGGTVGIRAMGPKKLWLANQILVADWNNYKKSHFVIEHSK